MEFDIREYGAIGDGSTLNTKAIQQAIDQCFTAGGGKVVIAGGTYLTGTIILKTGVALYLAQDGILYGSPHCEDYPEQIGPVHIKRELLPRKRSSCLIFAEECENIAITGPGTIDCHGDAFIVKSPGDQIKYWPYERIDSPTPPRAVFFTGCKNIRIEDVTMVNQPSGWSYWIHDCDLVTCDKLKIFANLEYPNNDGIHINSSRNVTVSNCIISTGDDCIVVRANNSSLANNQVCEKVTVTNCTLTSWASGIRIGWINDGTIRNCVFSNLVMTDTTNGIEIRLPGRGQERLPDEGREDTLIENLSFHNIMMDRASTIMIRISIADNPATHCKAIRNIYYNGIHGRGHDFISLEGREDCPIENIHFTNCTFEKQKNAPKNGLNIKDQYLPIHMEHTKNVVFQNTSFTVE